MAALTRQTAYWFSVVLYTILLAGVLLYLRFPAEKFRLFVQNVVEDRLPETSCSIGGIGVSWPPALEFRELRLAGTQGKGDVVFVDPRLTVAPVWSSLSSAVAITSAAYSGNHRLLVGLSDDDSNVDLRSIEIKALNLAEVESLGRKLDRRITGLLDAQGTAAIAREGFGLLRLEADVAISDGEMALKRPILELDTLMLETGSASVTVNGQAITIAEGKIENQSLSAAFAGLVTLAESLLAGTVNLEGSITPRPALFQQNRQLKVIVNRMQKRYGSDLLPFEVGGTVGRPTFVFEK
ncbi:MAG TPA: type II secretion system protein GspN [Desulfopila sp.]|nr:type II secretion system protein GspN [Desulfopila sp.]